MKEIGLPVKDAPPAASRTCTRCERVADAGDAIANEKVIPISVEASIPAKGALATDTAKSDAEQNVGPTAFLTSMVHETASPTRNIAGATHCNTDLMEGRSFTTMPNGLPSNAEPPREVESEALMANPSDGVEGARIEKANRAPSLLVLRLAVTPVEDTTAKLAASVLINPLPSAA